MLSILQKQWEENYCQHLLVFQNIYLTHLKKSELMLVCYAQVSSIMTPSLKTKDFTTTKDLPSVSKDGSGMLGDFLKII